jgi:hypothetical protein
MEVNPEPSAKLPAGAEIILIGSVEAEDRFLGLFPEGRGRRRRADSSRTARVGTKVASGPDQGREDGA